MAQRTLRCYVHGRDHDWQAICVDLDLAVQASSKRAAQKALEEAIISYIEDARAEAPEVARQLLARRAPWHVRAKLHLASVLYRLRTRGEKTANFEVPCPV